MIIKGASRRSVKFWAKHLTDTKTVPFVRTHGEVRQPGDPLHDHWLRLTIESDMVIHDVVAAIDQGPQFHCGEIIPNFKSLIGLKIGAGWRKDISTRVGGVKGCTHLVELLGPLGTTAFHASGKTREKFDTGVMAKKPIQLNSCHVYKDDGALVLKRWPTFYAGPR